MNFIIEFHFCIWLNNRFQNSLHLEFNILLYQNKVHLEVHNCDISKEETHKTKNYFTVKTISEQISRIVITSLAYQWKLCSEWVPSEWHSKQLIKTSHVDSLWIVVMFLSIIWTLICDGTHSLQRIHQWANDEMRNSSKSVQMNTKTHL